jgi:choline-sulfatase
MNAPDLSKENRWGRPVLHNVACFPYDDQPLRAASERHMRNHMDLNVLEKAKRFPCGA